MNRPLLVSVFFVWALAILAVGLAGLLDLRPLADDYCWAAVAAENADAGEGVVGASLRWYRSWTGALIGAGLIHTLVGAPLANFPLEFGSSVPAIATLLVLCSAAHMLLGTRGSLLDSKLRPFVTVAPWVVLAWWGYWWAPAALGLWSNGALTGIPGAPALAMRAERLTLAVHWWQNVAVAYVVLPCIWTALVARMHAAVLRDSSRRSLLWIPVGLLLGQSGLLLAPAVCGFVVFLALQQRMRGVAIPFGTYVRSGGFVAMALAGWLLDYYSPGSGIRADQLSSPFGSIPDAVSWMTYATARDAGVALATGGWWIVFAIGVLLGAHLLQRDSVANSADILDRTKAVAAATLSYLLIVRAAESLTGEGWHHAVPVYVALFFCALALGVIAGRAISSKVRSNAYAGVGTMVLVLGILSLSVGEMTESTRERERRWASMAASVPYIDDIETEWVRACWGRWGERRDLPDRTH